MAGTRTTSRFETMADLLKELGGIAPKRVRLKPAPGKATERDVVAIHDRTDRLFELIDGVLVEKVMGFLESALACHLSYLLATFLEEHDLGILAGPDGTLRLMPGLVRIPDISFVSWNRLPGRVLPTKPIPDLVPDLAVEVLSEGNTKGEMQRKLKEYFLTGVQLVWFVDPRTRTIQIYTAPDQFKTLAEGQVLDGGNVLPGLALPVSKVFAKMPPARKKSKRRGPQAKKPRRSNGAS
jgi:Uma2 family endonuclease